MSGNIVIRPNFGRVIGLGDIFDITSDQKVGHIFKREIPQSCIKVQPCHNQHLEILWTDNYSKKFEQLKIEGEAKLGVLCKAFVDIDGAAKFFTEKVPSKKTVQCHLIQSIKTVHEELNPLHEDLKDCYLKKVSNGTHLVVGITWGANAIATILCEKMDDDKKKEVHAHLNVELANIPNLLGRGAEFLSPKPTEDSTKGKEGCQETTSPSKLSGPGLKFTYDTKDNETLNSSKIEVKFNADILPTEYKVPRTIEEALNIIELIPKCLAEKDQGKGKAMYIHLMPLGSLQDNLENIEISSNCVYTPIPAHITKQIEYLFEAVEESNKKLEDFMDFIENNRSIVADKIYKDVDTYYKRFDTAMEMLRENFKCQLFEVRSGGEHPKTLEDIKEKFEEGPYAPSNIQAFLDKYINVKDKIGQFTKFVEKGAEIISKMEDFLAAKRDRNKKIYMLFVSFLSDRDCESWDGNITHFTTLCDTMKHEQYKFLVIDKDVLPEIPEISNGIRICLFFNNEYTSKDVFEEQIKNYCTIQSTEKLSITEKPRNVTVTLVLPCPGSFLNDSCEENLHEWKCHACKESLKYGFDNNLYCKCGHHSVYKSGFKCTSVLHGDNYVSYEENKLKDLLAKIELPKTCYLRDLVYENLLTSQLKEVGHTLKFQGYSVVGDVYVDNYTNETLVCEDGETVFGNIAGWSWTATSTSWIYKSPHDIDPGIRFSFRTHPNRSQILVGIRANCCWRFRDRLILLYWAVPKSSYGACNTFGVAITKPGTKSTEIRFSSLVSGRVDIRESFDQYVAAIEKKVKEGTLFKTSNSIQVRNTIDYICVEDDDIEILGSMTLGFESDINIQVIPKKKFDYVQKFADFA